jgi:hypothetical protein
MKLMKKFAKILIGGCVAFCLASCTPETAPTARPTHALSAPALAPSPTVAILTSDQLYGQETPRFGVNDLTAASLPSGQELPPIINGTLSPNGSQGVEIILLDNSRALGALYESNALGRAPAILLLSRNSGVWGNLPLDLQASGFTVMSLVLPNADYSTEELGEILNTLGLVSTVDPGRMAVIAEIESADFALQACAIQLLCDALVMLSPVNRDATLGAVGNFIPRPLFLAVAQDDPISYPTTLALSGVTQGASTFSEYPTGRGAGLLTLNTDLTSTLIAWLRDNF